MLNTGYTSGGTGLYIVVTFSNLVEDVKQIACSSDRVDYIAPPNIDPHEYQLTPSDISKLRDADIIISTSHTHFELEIKELKDKGVIKADLIEIPSISNISIRNNPVTKQPNYHMVIYDPYNYIVFINALRDKLVELNPNCREHYVEASRSVINMVLKTISETPRLNTTAVADKPFIQYGVEWIGVKIVYFLVKEHDLPVSQNDLVIIEEYLKNNSVDLVVISHPKDKYGEWLESTGLKYGKPVLYVPSPLVNEAIPSKLLNISMQIRSIYNATTSRSLSKPSVQDDKVSKTLLNTLALSLMIGVIVALVLILKRRM